MKSALIKHREGQMVLDFEPGLVERYASLRDCVATGVYQRGLKRVAIDLDQAPSNLSVQLSEDGSRHFSIDFCARSGVPIASWCASGVLRYSITNSAMRASVAGLRNRQAFHDLHAVAGEDREMGMAHEHLRGRILRVRLHDGVSAPAEVVEGIISG